MADVISKSDGPIRWIEINRPAKRNALTSEMYLEISRLLEASDQDPEVRVIVIRGSDKIFTAGNDLKDFLERPPVAEGDTVLRFLDLIRDATKPIIAAVAGPAVGVGTTLLMHCDLVVAGERSSFSAPFTTLGITPEAGSTFLVPAFCGPRLANRLFVLGETIGAEEALRFGLVSHVVGDEDVMAKAREFAERIAHQSERAVRESKRLMRRSFIETLQTQMEAERVAFAALLGSEEARKQFLAFLTRQH